MKKRAPVRELVPTVHTTEETPNVTSTKLISVSKQICERASTRAHTPWIGPDSPCPSRVSWIRREAWRVESFPDGFLCGPVTHAVVASCAWTTSSNECTWSEHRQFSCVLGNPRCAEETSDSLRQNSRYQRFKSAIHTFETLTQSITSNMQRSNT